MKKLKLAFSILSFAILLIGCKTVNELQEKKDNSPTLLLEHESKLGFDETVDQLNTILPTDGWNISNIHDLQKALKKNGKSTLPVKVFELCNAKYSSKILEVDDIRSVSLMMPCRISVYEKSNGKTYITLMNSKPIAKAMGGIVDVAMSEAQADIDKKVFPLFK